MSNHSFDADIATEYQSIEVAIMVAHFQYWIRKNKALGTNCKEGKTWTYQTYNDIIANFPYWSYDQVKRILKKCFQLGIITKGNFNSDKDDKTLWYAFNDEEKFGISKVEKREDLKGDPSGIGRNRPIDTAKSPDGSGEIARSYKDTDTITDALTDKNMSEPPFGRVASYFYDKLKGINPKVKKPNLEKWSKELHLLAKDGNSEADIIKAIDYVISTHGQASTNGFCWANVILSPTSLRNNFAKLWGQMGITPAKVVANPEENKKFAEKLQKQFQNRADMVFGYNYIEFINGMYSNKYEFLAKDFQEKCLHELRARKLIKDSA